LPSDGHDTGALRRYFQRQKKIALDPWNYLALGVFVALYFGPLAAFEPTYGTGFLAGMVATFVNIQLPTRDYTLAEQ